MKRISNLFDSRAYQYTDIYGSDTSKRLLHQEKRVRALLATELVASRLASSDYSRKILDIGCGAGNVLLELSRKLKNNSFYGYDISPEMVALARERATEHVCEKAVFEVGSVDSVSFKSDVVLSLGVVGYQGDQEAFLAALSDLVEEQGVLIVSIANGDSLTRSARRFLSEAHSKWTRRVKSHGIVFGSMNEISVAKVLEGRGFIQEEKYYITFGLGLFESSAECWIDRRLAKYLSKSVLGKYLSLTVVYVYRSVK